MGFILSFTLLIRNIIPYYYLIKWKEPKRKSIITWGISTLVMLSIYYLAYAYGFISPTLIVITITIPSTIILFLLSEHKDSRFLHTFTMVDNTTAVIFFLVDIFCYLLGKDEFLNIILRVVALAVICIISKSVSKVYQRLIQIKSIGWLTITLLSFIYYLMFYALIVYPTYISERREYLPVVILYCILVIVSYIVRFRIIFLTEEVCEAREKEHMLSAELEMQKNQMKLKKLYHKMAYTDGLTELKNRNAYEEKLKEIRERVDNSRPLWYISFDLNDLKQTNDTLGHHMGDSLIKSIAKALRETFHDNGAIYRIGGDEFVVILEKDISEIELLLELENLHKLLEQYSKMININIRVAYGYSLLKNNKNDNIDKVCIRADKLMYINKSNIKNNAV